MTRKCVLCKETNYKNSYSFFSAPKDPETRKKWQEAIAIENYNVSDDTYVCSRHFLPSDIITHWVSGVPPHVVTIKYKKCRLRPGAIPTTSCEAMNNMQNNEEDDIEDFEVNRNWGNQERRPATFADDKKEFFLIPRDDKILTYNSNDNSNNLRDNSNIENLEVEDYSSTDVGDHTLQEQVVDMIMDNHEQHQVLEVIQDDIDDTTVNTIYLKTSDDAQIVYIEDMTCKTDCIEEEIDEPDAKERIDEFSPDKQDCSGDECDESMEMWEVVDSEKITRQESCEKDKRQIDDSVMETGGDPLDLNDDDDEAMLFEDLLDVYTEVPLPRGWSSMVISKGRDTTVVYAYMTMTKSGVPYVEKQVFLNSDMILRCSASGREINSKLHNLLREGRQIKVHSLLDVEDIIEEFDQRVVCEGSLEKINAEDMDNAVAFRDGFKWRHIRCPIIINNGTTRCSKCSALNVLANRRKLKKPPQTAESAELLKKDRTIFVLQKLLTKMSKKNQRNESIKGTLEGKMKLVSSNQQQNIMNTLESLDIPKIQKVMMKECLRSSSNEKNDDYSETWIFLSLLLYIESPRAYKYLLVNKFMNLPGIKIMRRYLYQIKTDTQFYKLFQRSVEPFQVNEIDESTGPT